MIIFIDCICYYIIYLLHLKVYEHVYETVDVEGNAEIRANATAKVDALTPQVSFFMILGPKGYKQVSACLNIYLYFCSYLLLSK